MPPKAAAPANGDVANPQFKFVFSVLRHAGQIKVDWEEVAKDNGIGYGRNASSKFKDIVKKLGYKFEGNTICLPNETPAKANTAAAAKPAATRKRKNKKEDEGAEAEPKPAVKRKKPAPKVKHEDEGTENDGEEEEEENEEGDKADIKEEA